MKSGDLKTMVLSVLEVNVGLSVRDINEAVDRISSRDNAYTTIATVLSRLESEELVIKKKAKIDNRTVNLYFLSEPAYKKEVNGMVKDIFRKFGLNAVKHLGTLFDADLDEDELEDLEKKLESKSSNL